MADDETGWRIANWIWDRREEIAGHLRDLWAWFTRKDQLDESPGILILGPAGAGKTTLARFLSGDYDLLLNPPGTYSESLGIEEYALTDSPGIEVVVPPGQRHRREATWSDLLSDVAGGSYRGVIIVSAYGYHAIPTHSYKDHPLYKGNKSAFLHDLLAARRAEELEVLRQLLPAVQMCKNKLWLLNVVAKQDLWWSEQAQVGQYYREGEYGAVLDQALGKENSRQRHRELSFVSLVISNFTTISGESLAANTAGYDQLLQVQSLRRLLETVEALRQWEVRQ